jgi:hypothetical protein
VLCFSRIKHREAGHTRSSSKHTSMPSTQRMQAHTLFAELKLGEAQQGTHAHTHRSPSTGRRRRGGLVAFETERYGTHHQAYTHYTLSAHITQAHERAPHYHSPPRTPSSIAWPGTKSSSLGTHSSRRYAIRTTPSPKTSSIVARTVSPRAPAGT